MILRNREATYRYRTARGVASADGEAFYASDVREHRTVTSATARQSKLQEELGSRVIKFGTEQTLLQYGVLAWLASPEEAERLLKVLTREGFSLC